METPMKRTRRVNVNVGTTEVNADGITVSAQWETGKQRVEYVLRSDRPYRLAYLARAAITALEDQKSNIEQALRIARGQ
jgi:hypothetical protein